MPKVTQGTGERQLPTIVTALVGLDPGKDLHWVMDPSLRPMELFVEGKIDAFLATPPDLHEVRARNIAHVMEIDENCIGIGGGKQALVRQDELAELRLEIAAGRHRPVPKPGGSG